MQSTQPVDGKLSPSDYPRTYSAAFPAYLDYRSPNSDFIAVRASFAIKLEVDLSAATKKLESTIAALRKIERFDPGSRESVLAWKTLQEIE